MTILTSLYKKLDINAPMITQILNLILKRRFLSKSIESTFSNIYLSNYWGSHESVSGEGSNLSQTYIIREKLPILLEKYRINTLLDIPCGDFNWLSQIDLNCFQYIGGDIVYEIIKKNNFFFSGNKRTFKIIDITKDKLPSSDLLLCRDILVHFSYQDIFKTLQNIKKSEIQYLLTTNFYARNFNRNILTGGWRPINLTKPPFNFPKPLEIIIECCTEKNNDYYDKSLALWKINDLKL